MPTSTDLTILLFADVEKPEAWDHRWFAAVRELNPTVHDRLQVLLLSQRQNNDGLRKLAAEQPFEVEVVDCDHPRDRTGYPVWEVVPAVRAVWPRVRGRWVSFNHMEYIHGPDRLARTCNWLNANRPVIALGNLRRIVAHTYDWRKRIRDVDDPLNDCFAALIDDGQLDFLRNHWDLFGQVAWIYWHPEPSPADTHWWEDVFFADREWFEVTRFFEHGGRLPFQDIYDLMAPAINKIQCYELKAPCRRLPRQIHDSCHILHPRLWGSYTEAMWEWFHHHAEEFADTALTRDDLWEMVLAPGGCGDEKPGQAIDRFRRAPGGTVIRWLVDFSTYLREGGADRIREYMESRQT